MDVEPCHSPHLLGSALPSPRGSGHSGQGPSTPHWWLFWGLGRQETKALVWGGSQADNRSISTLQPGWQTALQPGSSRYFKQCIFTPAIPGEAYGTHTGFPGPGGGLAPGNRGVTYRDVTKFADRLPVQSRPEVGPAWASGFLDAHSHKATVRLLGTTPPSLLRSQQGCATFAPLLPPHPPGPPGRGVSLRRHTAASVPRTQIRSVAVRASRGPCHSRCPPACATGGYRSQAAPEEPRKGWGPAPRVPQARATGHCQGTQADG